MYQKSEKIVIWIENDRWNIKIVSAVTKKNSFLLVGF